MIAHKSLIATDRTSASVLALLHGRKTARRRGPGRVPIVVCAAASRPDAYRNLRGVGLGEPERTEVDDPKPPYPVMSDDAHAHRA